MIPASDPQTKRNAVIIQIISIYIYIYIYVYTINIYHINIYDIYVFIYKNNICILMFKYNNNSYKYVFCTPCKKQCLLNAQLRCNEHSETCIR